MYIKLSKWAKENNVTYRTAWNYFNKGLLQGKKLDTGTILVRVEEQKEPTGNTAVYSRVSSSENKSNLDSQAQRLVEYCTCRGYKVSKVIKEVGSGLNDKRPKLEALLLDKSITRIVVEHKDRLSRFGTNYIQKLLESEGRTIEVVNEVDTDEQDII